MDLYYFCVEIAIPDILEGSLQLHMKWLLKALIVDDKALCVQTVNERIKSFCFGCSDSANKPTAIRNDAITSSGNTMKQSCKAGYAFAV